ncbi:MAG: sigma-70 family RNA polymerase sigma factor [Planctomycetota bacterium]|nr:sigma-70 family RNA polymerase sigma factor [Planctomycetota bacterium]
MAVVEMEQQEDAQLVASAKGGDKIAFGVLVEKYRKRVMAMAYAVVQDIHIAEDVAQDVFVKAYRNLEKLRENEKFCVWLSKITYASAKDVLRKKEREKITLQKMQEQGMAEDAVANCLKEERDLNRIVMGVINEMPENMQVVLVMRFFDRSPYAEIAEFLNVSKDTIRGMVHRGMQYIRKRLRPYLLKETNMGEGI